jgi:hypothetical protein
MRVEESSLFDLEPFNSSAVVPAASSTTTAVEPAPTRGVTSTVTS